MDSAGRAGPAYTRYAITPEQWLHHSHRLSLAMAAIQKEIVVAFDLYGTLLSTESIAKELAALVGEEKAPKIASLWRRYQLEYTWRLNSMSMSPFR